MVPVVPVSVGVSVMVCVVVCDSPGVFVNVAVLVMVMVPVSAGVSVMVCVIVCDSPGVAVDVAVLVIVPVSAGVSVMVCVIVCDSPGVAVDVAVFVTVPPEVCVSVMVCVIVCDSPGVLVNVAVFVAVPVCDDAVIVCVSVGDDVKVSAGVSVEVAVEISIVIVVVGVGVFVAETVVVGMPHGFNKPTVFVSRITCPFIASSLPETEAPVTSVIVSTAIMVPSKTDDFPRLAELPTIQKTLPACAPLIRFTALKSAVVIVLPAINMNTEPPSPPPSRVSVPVIPNVAVEL
jgi:hypothetical protein